MNAALFLVLAATSPGQPPKPPAQPSGEPEFKLLRSVKDLTVTSPEKPKAMLSVQKPFAYVGGQAFNLYGTARAEQHIFVDADEKKRVKRLLWFQFEGYLPENQHVYRYQSKTTVTIGGHEFIADSSVRNLRGPEGRPDSDSARMSRLLKDKGYTMLGDDVAVQRLVHLMGDPKRDELMIIYLEDLSAKNLTAKDLSPGGKSAAQWEELSKGLRERAAKEITIATSK